jgi:hypothetical protein
MSNLDQKMIINVDTTKAICPIGEIVGKKNISESKIPVLSCEGACIRGEIARLAANIISKEKDWEDGCLMMIHPGIFRWHSICCPEYRSVFDLTIKTMSSRLSAPSCSDNPPNPISIWKVWP